MLSKQLFIIIAGYQDSEYKEDKEKLGRIMGIFNSNWLINFNYPIRH